MFKKNGLIGIAIVIAILVVDRITKRWALSLEDMVGSGYLNFFLKYNKSSFMGVYPEMSEDLKFVGLTTFGAIFVIFYGFVQLILTAPLFWLRMGLSFLLAGLLGNMIDRLFFDYAVDFIILGTQEKNLVFNVADIFQMSGLILIAYNLKADWDIIWPKDNKRTKKWINPYFQGRLIVLNFAMLSSLSFALFVFCFTFFKVTLSDYSINNNTSISTVFRLFLVLYFLINMVLFMCYFVISLIASHRIAGPVYAFKKYIRELLAHPKHTDIVKKQLVLRDNDEFEDLIELADEIKQRLQMESKK